MFICSRRETDQWEANIKKNQQPVRKFAQRDFDRVMCVCVCLTNRYRMMDNAAVKTKTKYIKPEKAESR